MRARPLQPDSPPTIVGALAEGSALLSAISDTPQFDAKILLANVLGCDAAWLIARGGDRLSANDFRRFSELCEKRGRGFPIAYITGFAGFFGREFAVTESVLIPRPETEHLVQDAIAHLRALELCGEMPRALDVGLGSGAIACTLAAEVLAAEIDGTETSERALRIARANARRLGVDARCHFYEADIAHPGPLSPYDAIVANLPYVPTCDVPKPPQSAGFEPREALDGGPDGLTYLRRLLARAPALLAPGGLLLMEAAPPTISALLALTRAAFPAEDIRIRRDYAGLDRYVVLEKSGSGAA